MVHGQEREDPESRGRLNGMMSLLLFNSKKIYKNQLKINVLVVAARQLQVCAKKFYFLICQ